MKRTVTLLLCLTLIFCCATGVLADDSRFSHFLMLRSWSDDIFSDVQPDDWFYDSLVTAYRMRLVDGLEDGTFAPDQAVTVAQAVKLAACINSLYRTADTAFQEGEVWYRCYVDYAMAQRMIDQEYDSYDRAMTRSEFAVLLSRALPIELYESINTVERGAIPDVSGSAAYAGAVYRLYRAGIMTGGSGGAFDPDGSITRAEAAAAAGRLMMENERRCVTLTAPEMTELGGEEIFSGCSQAVFYMEMYDSQGKKTANGSGFFIDSDGTAVTCWHVLEKGVSAKICIAGTGEIYDMAGVYDYDVDDDWAVIKINGSGFEYLEIGDGKTNKGGASVYALGSPLGLQNTITQGLICNPTRIEDGTSYILFSAAISSGSSGGALINKYGQVIGITAATYVYGQNLNLAINISYIDRALRSKVTPLGDVFIEIFEKNAAESALPGGQQDGLNAGNAA